MSVEILAEVERQGRAGVHKHAIPVAAQEKRYRLVHVFVLRPHTVTRRDQNSLPTLVEARKRFAASKNLFVVC